MTDERDRVHFDISSDIFRFPSDGHDGSLAFLFSWKERYEYGPLLYFSAQQLPVIIYAWIISQPLDILRSFQTILEIGYRMYLHLFQASDHFPSADLFPVQR
jgi:hypothetical protein